MAQVRAEIASLRAQLDELTMPRPMETAPRDGTLIRGIVNLKFDKPSGCFESEDNVFMYEHEFDGWLPLPKAQED